MAKRRIILRHREEERKAQEAEAQARADRDIAEAARKARAREAERQAAMAKDIGVVPGSEEFSSDPLACGWVIQRAWHDSEFMYPLSEHGREGIPDIMQYHPNSIERTITEIPDSPVSVLLRATFDHTNASRLEIAHRVHLERLENLRQSFHNFCVQYEGTIYSVSEFEYNPPQFVESRMMRSDRVQRSLAQYASASISATAIPDRMPSKRNQTWPEPD